MKTHALNWKPALAKRQQKHHEKALSLFLYNSSLLISKEICWSLNIFLNFLPTPKTMA